MEGVYKDESLETFVITYFSKVVIQLTTLNVYWYAGWKKSWESKSRISIFRLFYNHTERSK